MCLTLKNYYLVNHKEIDKEICLLRNSLLKRNITVFDDKSYKRSSKYSEIANEDLKHFNLFINKDTYDKIVLKYGNLTNAIQSLLD